MFIRTYRPIGVIGQNTFWPSLILSLVLTCFLGPATAETFTASDSFNGRTYAGNSGTSLWANEWKEVKENNGPRKGRIRVVAKSKRCMVAGCLRIGGNNVNLNGVGASRALNLSRATAANLTFSYKRKAVAGLSAGYVKVQVSPDGSTWTTLEKIRFTRKNDRQAVKASFDISRFAGPNTQIRFLGAAKQQRGYLFIDDVAVNFARNLPPSAMDDSYSMAEDTSLVMAVLTNDRDAENTALLAKLVGAPAHGKVAANADGSFIYTPAKDYYGIDTFTYVANDGADDSNVASVAITVTPTNDAPIAVNDRFSTAEDAPLVMAVLANDRDVDDTALMTKVVGQPGHGKLVANADGSFTYMPAKDFYGADAFTYVASDGASDSNVASVAISVTPVNDPPVAVNDTFSTPEDSPLTAAVLGNDSDLESTTLTAKLVTNPTHGKVALQANGTFIYTPAKDYNGADTFTYVANDGADDSNVATVAITVTPVNDPPLAVNDSYSTAEDAPLAVASVGVLGNDSDPEKAILTAKLFGQAAHGNVVLNADGSFTYTPAKDYNGTDSFTYAANDGVEDSNTATVAITVTPVPDAPVFGAASFNFQLKEDSAVGTWVGQTTASDVDVGDTLTYSIAADGSGGLLGLNAKTGELTVAALPTSKFRVGTSYNLTIQVADGTGLTAQVPVVVTITSADKVVDLKLLVIATGTVAEDSALKLMDDLLKQMAIPYEVLDASRVGLTDASLRASLNHARYNGVILTNTELVVGNGSGFTLQEWQTLHEFERYFGIREAVVSGWPTTDVPNLDLNYGMDNANVIAGSDFKGQWQQPAGGMEVFEYVNTANPLAINEWSLAARPVEPYNGAPSQNGNGPTVQPLVVCDPNSTVACTTQYAFVSWLRYNDGREVLLSTISNPWWSTHARILAYEFVNFATKGVFLGSRQAYLAAHVDDLFIADDLWDSVNNVTNETEGAGYLLSTADIQNTSTQQQVFRTNHPLAGTFTLDFAFNGEGVEDLNPLGNNRDQFAYINHTFSHMDMDATAGMTDPALAYSDITMNRSVWQNLGLPEHDANINTLVTGDHSGLMDDGTNPVTPYPDGVNLAFVQAAQNAGVRYLASNSSQLNQAEEQWLSVGGTQYDLLLLPRYPTNVFYNVTLPADLLDEYNYIYYERYFEPTFSPAPVSAGQRPCDTYPAAICAPKASYEEILEGEAEMALQHMLTYKDWPHFFHESNLRNYDGLGKTLVFDWLNVVVTRYEQVMKLPLKNLRYYDIGKKTENRVNARSAQLTGQWDLTTNRVTVTANKPVTITATGLDSDATGQCLSGELYGGQCQLPIDVGTTEKTLYVNQGLSN